MSVVGKVASGDDIRRTLRERSNWGRWGEDDQLGAINLISPETVALAVSTVALGRTVSLSRSIKAQASTGGLDAYEVDVSWVTGENGAGCATEYFGSSFHGSDSTHIDALCHLWDAHGMWNGRPPDEGLRKEGVRWGGVDAWKSGIVTRGVLFDIPAYRGTDFVDLDSPITGEELEGIRRENGVTLRPGDALVVYGGRDAWDVGHAPWGSGRTSMTGAPTRPGLDGSCLEFIRDADCSVLAWDMMDAAPNPPRVAWSVHGALYSFGIALIENCDLGELARTCREYQRSEFLLLVAPLAVVGGTGSLVNPIAVL